MNLTSYLMQYDNKARWNTRIKNYIKETDEYISFEQSKDIFWCSLDTAITYVNTLKADFASTLLNDLYMRKINELRDRERKLEDQLKATPRKQHIEHLAMYDADTIEDIAIQIVKDIQTKKKEAIPYIFNEYVYFFTHFYEFNTVLDHLKKIRNKIKESEIEDNKRDYALSFFTVPKRVHDYLNEGVRVLKSSRMKTSDKPIAIGKIHHFIELNKKLIGQEIPKKNKAEVFTKLVTMVSLACGRRLKELIVLSDFEKVNDYKIKVIGIGKKRETSNVKSIVIPTLFLTADETLKVIETLRSSIPKTLREDNNRAKHAHNLLKWNKIDSDLLVDGKTTSFRGLYAMTCEFIYNQNNPRDANKKRQDTYMQEILGHEDKDYEALKHYYKRNIISEYFDIHGYLKKAKQALM